MINNVQTRTVNWFYVAVLVAIIILGAHTTVTLVITDQDLRAVVVDIIYPIIDLLAVAPLLISAKQAYQYSKQRAYAWGAIGLALLFLAAGDITWGILEVVLEQEPFPSLADLFYLAYYPFFLTGAFLLTDKETTAGERINKVIDISIVMIAAILIFWNFFMAPIMISNISQPLLDQAILLAYPVGDLVLFGALTLIIFSGSNKQDRNAIYLLSASLVITIVTDSIYTYQALLETYISGGFLDNGWVASTLLVGLAGVSQMRANQSTNNGNLPTQNGYSGKLKTISPFLPYIWLVGAYILLVRGGLTHLPMEFSTLSLAVGIIIGFVLVRQIITLRENKIMNERLISMDKYQLQAKELEEANTELSSEIARRRQAEKKLSYDALHDAMTGLANRTLFLDRLGQAIEYARRHDGRSFAILFIDLDEFKVVNDSLGHLVGDQLLISISKRLMEVMRSSDTVARFGGDEFEILLDTPDKNIPIITVVDKIQKAIQTPFDLDGHEVHITASIGVITNVKRYDHPEELLRDADIAMYQAKAHGKARFEIFDIEMRNQMYSRLEIEQGLRKALENKEFQLYYQPIMSLESDRIVGLEALIRWIHPERGTLLPDEFLPVAEDSGLILPIGDWVLNEACTQLKAWQTQNADLQNISVNVNISNKQFSQPNLVEKVDKALQDSGLKATALKLEISEGVLINNYARANEIFEQLLEMGIQLQIDDFGTGYSALGYLQRFPISAIKIDKSFINEMGKGQKGTGLIRAMVSMARELNMETIAEGIETGNQLDELKNLLCGYGQGFLLSKPMDQESVRKLLIN